ncbi:inositol monophosphatase family protein [Rubrobacter indicoceani]|uniref:inositol monophosphatase family protein n=1 Tax=Rubrobacter indicoceani TaxID=2051957 RepID=UPI000E5B7CDF|nr:inositol monophosphatase family protein [Rubrobacter indicoceani]
MTSDTEPLQKRLDFATEVAFEAGRLTLGYFQTNVRPEFKADDTPVTVADREAEAMIRTAIKSRYPDHAIAGEEFGSEGPDGATHRWYIDPIDGTKAFVRGVPLYAVLIALEIEGAVRVGAAYFPALGEMISAADGLGCRWNGRLARVSEEPELSRSVICFTETGTFEEEGKEERWSRLRSAAYSCRGWSDAYGHLLVATGRVEAMVEPAMNPWDCAPFAPILREAGGYFGDWSGNGTIHENEAVSSNAAILPEVLRLLGDSATR